MKYVLPAALAVFWLPCMPALSDPGLHKWEDIGYGVRYLHHVIEVEDGPVHFYAAVVDLSKEGVEVVVSPPRYIGAKTSKFAGDIGAQVAINGGFWTLVTHKPLGLVVSAGRKWKDAKDDQKYGFLAISQDGSAWISPPEEVRNRVDKDIYMALAGYPMIVRGGKIDKVQGCGYICMKHPRAAVGLDKTGSKLFLVVSDGRQEDSVSISLTALAEFMTGIGVWDAVNLDGGGSATLFVKEMGGVANAPCEGKERSVLNSMAVILRGTGQTGSAPGGERAVAEASVIMGHPSHDGIHFSDEDFEMEGEMEHPSRVVNLAKAAGIFSAVIFLIMVSSSIILVRKRRRKS